MTPSEVIKANHLLNERDVLLSKLASLDDVSVISVRFSSYAVQATEAGTHANSDSGALFKALRRVLAEQITMELARVEQKLFGLGVEVSGAAKEAAE